MPLLAGDHVTDDAGTGFVHTAPGHGADDYAVWLAHGHREIPETVDADGAYYPDVPLFGGLKVLETEGKKAGKFGPANNAVMDKLIEAGNLLARGRLEHSYPHSWRSKAPVIFRNTPQWFIRMDEPLNDDRHGGRTLRETALEAIEATAFYPDAGRNRIRSMVESRPDWLISRQRAWGSPLAMFVDKATGQPLHDADVNARIVDLIAVEGADAWFTRPAADFLGDHDPDRYEKVEDILDVWFDSGSTHAFVLEDRAAHPLAGGPLSGGLRPASRLVPVVPAGGLRHARPRAVRPGPDPRLHGHETGEKMSKSLGNAVDPADVIRRERGRDPAPVGGDDRLFRGHADRPDHPADHHRRLSQAAQHRPLPAGRAGRLQRGRAGARWPTCRPWSASSCTGSGELDGEVRGAYETYRFQDVWRPLADFCSNELSALYFDIRKDILYCDRPDSLRRRACRTVMDLVFERLTAWLAPLAAFTMEEAWETRFPRAGSNALRVIPDTPAAWRNPPRPLAGRTSRRSPAWSPARWRSSGAKSASEPRWKPRRRSGSPIRV